MQVKAIEQKKKKKIKPNGGHKKACSFPEKDRKNLCSSEDLSQLRKEPTPIGLFHDTPQHTHAHTSPE
jgi:hypothetical protein